ncbi:MAG: flagellar export protein FliJ [Thermodesulfobacteriota bacterium]
MKYSFRLQSLLNWKRNLEESSQMRLGEMVKRLRAQEEEIEKLIQQRLENEKTLHRKMEAGIYMREYLIHKQFGEDSYQELVEQQGKKRYTLTEIARERALLTGLMRERKILEKLKERGFKKFLDEMEKQDQKCADERAIQSHRVLRRETP